MPRPSICTYGCTRLLHLVEMVPELISAIAKVLANVHEAWELILRWLKHWSPDRGPIPVIAVENCWRTVEEPELNNFPQLSTALDGRSLLWYIYSKAKNNTRNPDEPPYVHRPGPTFQGGCTTLHDNHTIPSVSTNSHVLLGNGHCV